MKKRKKEQKISIAKLDGEKQNGMSVFCTRARPHLVQKKLEKCGLLCDNTTRFQRKIDTHTEIESEEASQ